MAYTQNTRVSQKRRIFLRVWEPEEEGDRTHYYAKAGRLEIEGWVYYGGRDDVKEVVRRALKAEGVMPEQIEKAVDLVVNYLTAGAVQLGLTTVAASAGYDYNESEGLTFTVEMFYGDDGRWTVEIRVVNDRHNGRHILKKSVTMDQVTTEALRKIVGRVVRQAYNAYL
jgi:hypothetical protein